MRYGKYKYPVTLSPYDCFYKMYGPKGKQSLVIKANAYSILCDFAETILLFPFKHDGIRKVKVAGEINTVGHCHNIDELVLEVYLYPESFEAVQPEYYSNIELAMISDIKNKCLSSGLRDIRKYDIQEDIFIDYVKEYKKRGIKLDSFRNYPSVKRVIE